ncbi:MAG: sigma-70 family RNA polymerase sigma factor [Spirochaetes bacterium]|nr:sigma-70 family RNA polymerase sigma factor [Spirochaetota bacterium]
MTDIEFAAIVGRTKKVVLGAVRKHLAVRFSFAIDDVVQETYLRGYRHLAAGRFREESSVESWLYAIARNESIRMNGKLAREEEKAARAAEERELSMAGASLSDEALAMDLLLERLPEKYKTVMTLKAQGVTEKEIALALGITMGTVKSRFSRGKEMLQKLSGEVV